MMIDISSDQEVFGNTIEFRRALVPDEIEALCEVDRRIFHAHPADLFSKEFWAHHCEAYWMTAKGRIIGCCAFQLNCDHSETLDVCVFPAPESCLNFDAKA